MVIHVYVNIATATPVIVALVAILEAAASAAFALALPPGDLEDLGDRFFRYRQPEFLSAPLSRKCWLLGVDCSNILV